MKIRLLFCVFSIVLAITAHAAKIQLLCPNGEPVVEGRYCSRLACYDFGFFVNDQLFQIEGRGFLSIPDAFLGQKITIHSQTCNEFAVYCHANPILMGNLAKTLTLKEGMTVMLSSVA